MSDHSARAKMRLVDDLFAGDARPGDAKYYAVGGEPDAGLHFICPGCGLIGGVAFSTAVMGNPWTRTGPREAPTARPSILHDSESCGWHGYLTDGEFVPC